MTETFRRLDGPLKYGKIVHFNVVWGWTKDTLLQAVDPTATEQFDDDALKLSPNTVSIPPPAAGCDAITFKIIGVS